MLHSFDLEQRLLAGLLKYPEKYTEISSFIDENDFWSEGSKINRTLFLVLRQIIENGDEIDEIIVSERVSGLGISFTDNSNPSEYIESLSLKKISPESVCGIARELKRYTVRREISSCGQTLSKKMASMSPSADLDTIVQLADQIYNDQINLYENGSDKPENIFESMEDLVEERGNNPVDEFGFSGPHPKLQDMYGSLLRPGNITVIVARSGVGKTQFCLDFVTKVSSKYSVPVLHFDNGEMSKEELIFRQCSAMSGVPMYLLESGNWRKAGDEIVNKVRSVWKEMSEQYRHLYYYNIGGMNVDSQINVLKRFYYSKIGRGNPLIFSFDYIKTTSENMGNKNEWQVVGDMVDKYKKCIQRDILSDIKEPIISMITSVQSNRSGIVTNRNATNVVDDESIVSLSDRITQFSSHMFILRNKTNDELLDEADFGTHKLINVKARHLGRDIAGAINFVRMPDDTLRKNFINLEFKNFCIIEKGDLRDIVESQSLNPTLEEDGAEEIPDLSI